MLSEHWMPATGSNVSQDVGLHMTLVFLVHQLAGTRFALQLIEQQREWLYEDYARK